MKPLRFRKFHTMAKKVGFQPFDENSKIAKNSLVEEIDGCVAVFACPEGLELATQYAKENGLLIATETLNDNDDGSVSYVITDGVHYVNRERFFFYKKDISFVYQDKV